jgi:predicted GIY-YIG superfamily endonuclease
MPVDHLLFVLVYATNKIVSNAYIKRAFRNYDTAYQAIQREKNIKHWPRAWKTRLIAKENDTWRDLYDDIAQP